MRPTLRAVLLAVPLALVTAGTALAGNGGIAPVAPASPNAAAIRDIWWVILGISLAIFVIVETALLVFIVKYRRGRRSRETEGAQVHGHTRTEIVWTVIPVLIVFAIVAVVFAELPSVKNAPAANAANTVNIQVEGHQFYWLYRYPGGRVSINQMVVPVNDVVNLTVNAADVIHAWWIPALGGQIDAIPGRTNHTWFQATKKGTFVGQCAQLCGVYHAKMFATVKVVSEPQYRAFLAAHSPGSPLVAAEVYVGVCATCHGMNGQGAYGPALQGRTFDPADITRLLREGRTGNQGHMPAVGSDWNGAQINAVIAYLQKIHGGPPSGS